MPAPNAEWIAGRCVTACTASTARVLPLSNRPRGGGTGTPCRRRRRLSPDWVRAGPDLERDGGIYRRLIDPQGIHRRGSFRELDLQLHERSVGTVGGGLMSGASRRDHATPKPTKQRRRRVKISVGLILPEINTEAMNLYSGGNQPQVSPGAHAVMILGGAGWHQRPPASRAGEHQLAAAPLYSPELKPVGNVRGFSSRTTSATGCSRNTRPSSTPGTS